MKKRITAMIAAAAMACSCFGMAASAEEQVTLRFAWWGGDDRLEATLAVIEASKQKIRTSRLKLNTDPAMAIMISCPPLWPEAQPRILYRLTRKTMPTYVEINPDYFLSFDEYGFDFSNFDEGFLRTQINGYYDGQQLGIPTGIAGPTLLVNQDLADAIGIDFSQDYDWDDLIEWGKQVREYDDSMYLLSANKSYITTFISITTQNSLPAKRSLM